MWKLIKSFDIDSNFEKNNSNKLIDSDEDEYGSLKQYLIPLEIDNIKINTVYEISKSPDHNNIYSIELKILENYGFLTDDWMSHDGEIGYKINLSLYYDYYRTHQRNDNFNIKFYTKQDIYNNYYLKLAFTVSGNEHIYRYQVFYTKKLKEEFLNLDTVEFQKILSQKLPPELISMIFNYIYNDYAILKDLY